MRVRYVNAVSFHLNVGLLSNIYLILAKNCLMGSFLTHLWCVVVTKVSAFGFFFFNIERGVAI